MDQHTIRIAIVLFAVVLLAGVNVAAAVLGVPVITATIGDAISLLLAFGGILMGTKVPPAPPKP
jgi:hypothetical protein